MTHFVWKAAGVLACSGLLGLVACKNTTSVGGSGGSGGDASSTGTGLSIPAPDADKVDLLFVVDNSRSMADKQEAMALALTDLVQSLVNPPCIDANGDPAPLQPSSGLDPCPAGTQRVYDAVNDIHIGVISTSLGGVGADACPNQDNNSCAPNPNFSNNDKGHLLSRVDACDGGSVPTYQDKGFLAWDPTAKLNPSGDSDVNTLALKFKDIVLGAGQIGCGYESQLESWYRFLVDPEPYASISVIDNKATPAGLDQELLTQRAEFLRPDSLLAIVMLTDENDCSTKDYGQFFFARQLKNGNQTAFHLPRARAVCASDPNDPCCASCGQEVPSGCQQDPTCFDGGNNVKALTDIEDTSNLRCFEQKRRFGIDFLQPVERYITALTSASIPNRQGELVPNPIFSDLQPSDDVTTIRDPSLVVFAGVIGVPWQDIARDKDDLTKGYMSSAELGAVDGNGSSRWDVILGNPALYQAPTDPLMVESVDARSGTNPITGDAIATSGNANPINGHDYTIPLRDDLQYACIFDIPTPRNCADPSLVSCDCYDPGNTNPLCVADPDTGDLTVQTRAKAYPGIRHLSVLKGVGGVVASVCPTQLSDPAKADYAYRPAISSLIERMRERLKVSGN